MSKSVLIVEPRHTGHRMTLYVRQLLAEGARRGVRVRLMTSSQSADAPALAMLLAEGLDVRHIRYADERDARLLSPKLRRVERQFRAYAAIRKAFRALGPRRTPDVVIVPSSDSLDRPIAFLGSPFGCTPFAVGSIGATFHRSLGAPMWIPQRVRSAVDRAVLSRLLAVPTLTRCFTADRSLVHYARVSDAAHFRKVVHVPEPAAFTEMGDRSKARAALGIDADAFVVLVYGALSRRKGILSLLRAMQYPAARGKTVALLVGRQDPDVRRDISAHIAAARFDRTAVVMVDEVVDAAMERDAFGATDVVWLGYARDFTGPSGVLAQSHAVGLPVLASAWGEIGEDVRRSGTGLLVDSENEADVAEALGRLVMDERLYMDLRQRTIASASNAAVDGYASVIFDDVLHSARTLTSRKSV